ncbi:MAG: AAA family ATPase [Lachnospiraceae bacterium]
MYIKEELYRYLLKLVTATREHPYIRRGASPRATIALVKMARACAWIAGRDYVIPSDISRQFPYVIGHRILLKPQTAAEGISREEILKEILAQVRKPSMGMGKNEKSRLFSSDSAHRLCGRHVRQSGAYGS